MFAFPSKDGLKKWLSSLLIFLVFATQTFQIPLSLTKVLAAGSDAPNLVSILVSASTNSGTLKARIKRYANDIQAALTNTRVVIVEVADNIAPHNIAALNEKLYYEGDGNGISRLVGTILIGKLPIPVVHKGTTAFLSVYPYTDFDEKVFIYDAAKGYYDAVSSPVSRDTPEIWHGVIQPNTGSSDQDTEKLISFLDKTHDYYVKSGVFAQTTVEPYVFYLDIDHDQSSSNSENWKAYNLGIEYLEDVAYNRFSKHLAKEIYDKYTSFQKGTDGIDQKELAALGVDIPDTETTDFSSAPDIQTRTAITKITKQFYEIINEKYVGDILKFVFNAGRYGDGKNTRVDVGAVLVSKRDEFMKRSLKDANTAVEGAIDSVVKNGLSQDIALPVAVKVKFLNSAGLEDSSEKAPFYQNYFFGKKAADIKSAKECSIERGSSLPVEANRGYNILNIDKDLNELSQYGSACFPGGSIATTDLWGGNTPLSLQTSTLSAEELTKLSTATSPSDYEGYEDKLGNDYKLKGNTYKNYVVPTFDLLGQKELSGSVVSNPASPLHLLTPSDCLTENFIADPYVGKTAEGTAVYHSQLGSGGKFVCIMRDSLGKAGHKYYPISGQDSSSGNRFQDAISGKVSPPACTKTSFELDGLPVASFGKLCENTTGGEVSADGLTTSPIVTIVNGTEETYAYKKLPSWIEHKSPTDEEYGSAIKGMSTPSLAADRDRYIDFIGPQGTTVKIAYPNFYRLTWPNEQNLTAEMVNAKIKETLDAKSAEINKIIGEQDPTKLGEDAAKLYGILLSGPFPKASVDLYGMLASSGNSLSALIDTLIWYNLGNATSKYAFVLENFLDSDGNRDYPLIGGKKGYELGYIGGSGDARNMYVKVDPAAKGTPPQEITDIQTSSESLMNMLDASNMGAYSGGGEGKFKCGPPEGVPLWQWIPAIFCWLGSIIPPTIGAGSCGPALSSSSQAAQSHFTGLDVDKDGKPDWNADTNSNGILDGYEWIQNGTLALSAPQKRMKYHSNTALTAELKQGDTILAHDSFNEVHFDVEKIILKSGQRTASGETVSSDKVVYSRGGAGDAGKIETLKKYITFTPIAVRAEAGVANYTIGSIDRDVDVYLDAYVAPKDKNGQVAFTRKTDAPLELEIRNEALKIDSTIDTQEGTAVYASGFKAGTVSQVNFALSVTNFSGAQDATVEKTNAKSPIEVKILDDVDDKVLQDTQKISGNTYSYNGELLKKSGSYRFEFNDADNRFESIVVDVLPADPVRVEAVVSSNIFVKGQKDTILVSAIDAFGNIAKGDLLQINGIVSGGGYFVQNRDTKLQKSTIEGMTSFDVSTNDGGQELNLTFSVTDSTGKRIQNDGLKDGSGKGIGNIKSIDSAIVQVEVPNREKIIAGGEPQEIKIHILDSNHQVIDGFNGVASIDFPKNSGKFSSDYISIKNGSNSGMLAFVPDTVAIIDGKIDIQVPGIETIEGGKLTVYPNVPMRVGLTSSVDKMEAKLGLATNVQARLFDRYGNLAYNHASGMQANFKIPNGYEKYGTLSSSGAVAFSGGIATTEISASNNPGQLYYMAEVTPDLSSNSFTITENTGSGSETERSLTIKGYSKNVGSIDTYYLWNAEKIKKTNYNVFYTTLIGADYGNVTVPGYLAGELLFNEGSQSLAVTSLLNDAKKKSEIIQMTPGGKITLNNDSLSSISVGSNNGRTTLDIFDPFKRENIGRFYLNIRLGTDLFACESSDADNLDACDVQNKSAYIVMKGTTGLKTVKKSTGLSLLMDDTPVVEISANGLIKKYPSISIEADGKETKNLLSLSIKNNNTSIGRIGIKWDSARIEMASSDTLNQALENNSGENSTTSIDSILSKIANLGVADTTSTTETSSSTPSQSTLESILSKIAGLGGSTTETTDSASATSSNTSVASQANTSSNGFAGIIYESLSPRYTTEQNYIGNSSYGAKGIKIFNQTDSTSTQVDRNMIGSSDKQGFEEYAARQGIGFGNGNNSLLEFASQASVGESTRATATYSQITLGDPVARLSEILSNQNYDRTLGKQIAIGNNSIMESYTTFDYNGDNQEDIVVFYKDGKVELLQNYNGTYKSLGYLLYVADTGVERKGAGDFNGDSYGDVIMTDNRGKLIVIENRNGKFTRVPTKIYVGASGTGSVNGMAVPETEVSLGGAIMQMEFFDMDKDGKMDLVISDDSGELNILYGTMTPNGGVAFTKKLLDKNIGLKMGTGSINTGGAIRYDGIKEIVATEQKEYIANADKATDDNAELLTAEEQTKLLDSKIYYQQSVSKQVASAAEAKNIRIANAVGTDDPYTPEQSSAALTEKITQGIDTLQAKAASGSFDTSSLSNTTIEEQKTFLRSEFADGKNIIVDKKYEDINGGSLQAGDLIRVNVSLTNSGTAPLTHVSYLDSYEKNIFQLGEKTEYSILGNSGSVTSSGTLNELTKGEFDFQFDGLEIPVGKKLTIQYQLIVNAISFGKFKVGVFETDDIYGDVSMSANAICGDAEILWKSIVPTPRSYERTTKEIEKKGDVSGEQDGKFTDFNGNKNPDYIDILQGEGGDDALGGSLWDSSQNGLLVFREVPTDGVIDGTSLEIGRIVANKATGNIQINPVSGEDDIPALVPAFLNTLTRDASGIGIGSVADLELPECGSGGTVTSNLALVGVRQDYNKTDMTDLKGLLKIRAIGKSNTLDAAGNIVSSLDCKVSIDSTSNPSWDGSKITGLGWKVLTKSTFAHFSLGGTQADLVDSSSGIPDSHEPVGEKLFSFNSASNNGGINLGPNGVTGTIDLGGMSEENIDKINASIDTLVQGLSCGFGGGSCLSLPMNWAPLAPGSSPVIFGNPTPALSVDTGYPVFSALTGNQTTCGKSPCCLPSVFPIKKQAYIPGPVCGSNSAGGKLGTWAPTNFFRFFITPTITGSIGVAACFGGPAKVTGKLPPKKVSPLVPGGNCVVASKPLSGCKDDGSDGAIEDLGTPDTGGTINAGSCKNKTTEAPLTSSEKNMIREYVKGNNSFASDIIKNMAGRASMLTSRAPLLNIGATSQTDGSSMLDISIDPANITNFDKGVITKIQLDRVSAFPDFIMDWVNRQLEEVANKLTSLPTIMIIKPDFRGALDSEWIGATDKLESAYKTGASNGTAVFGNETAGRSISGVKAAYEVLSRFPLLKFEKTTINVNYPDIGKEDLTKLENNLKATIAQWDTEIQSKKKLYAATATKEGLDASVFVQADALKGSLAANLAMIENYKKFPEKLAKYLTWKERYAKQLLCNINAIQNMLDGFIAKNAQRFKAWIEFTQLIKNILKGWQLIPELFYKHDAQCAVCRNERYDAKYSQFKVIKSVIPPIPIIKFPKWPDIILDLHNVRMGLRIAMPELVFTPTPIVLPVFPKLGLPTVPTVGITLPSIPVLPSIPPLPELPDIPSLPTITLPELPPPPTIPKLFGGIKFTLNILKILDKVLCYMNEEIFVPEWRAGDRIAQTTTRQGKLGIDFLNIEFPQFNASFVDAIKVTTFVNFEFQIDFILEMARSTFEPINQFTSNLNGMTADLGGAMPKNVDLRGLNPGKIEVNVPGPTMLNTSEPASKKVASASDTIVIHNYAKFLAQAFVSTMKQGQSFASETAEYQDVRENLIEELSHTYATPGTQAFTILEDMKEGLNGRGDSEADALKEQLLSENQEKFNLATNFVKSELNETNVLLAELNLVREGKKSLSEIFGKGAQKGNATLTASTESYSTESELPDFSKFNERAQKSYVAMVTPTEDNELKDIMSGIQTRLSTYSSEVEKKEANFAAAVAVTNPGAGSTSSDLASYEYRGIYAFDSNRQIRLFDYTNDLEGSERAIPVNRLGNGATEYIYKSGDILYLKTRLGNSEPRPVTDSISTYSLSDILPDGTGFLGIGGSSDTSREPTAPNHFVERFASSGEINFSFRVANKDRDSIFRLEFYDYIDRFDRLMKGEALPRITPMTRTSYVDLVPKLTNETVINSNIPGLVTKKPYAVYGPGNGEGSMLGATYRTLGSGERIRVASNRSIYSDGGTVEIAYKEAENSKAEVKTITIGNSEELLFLTTMDIQVLRGNVILIEDSTSLTPRTADLSSLKGLPVILGQKIEIPRAEARLDISYYNGASLAMNGHSLYQSYDLGSKSSEYSVSIRDENAWYYAKLENITPITHTSSRITLLSPQKEADKEAPLIQLGKGLRAPVYIEQKIDLRDSISDTSGIQDVFIDTDTGVDTDGDGKKDNDRNSDSADGMLRKGISNLEWYIKPQNSLFEKKIKIWATDEMKNTAGKETTLTIYAPIPNIDTQTGTTIHGKLNESLVGEPISILRFRNGELAVVGEAQNSGTGGIFENILETESGSGSNTPKDGAVVRTADGTEIAKINEKTGVISLTDSGTTISVSGASADVPVQIQVIKSGKVLYSESLALGKLGKIESVGNMNEAIEKATNGVGVALDDEYKLVKNTSSSTALPGGAFVVDSEKKAAFGIAKDGNIYLIEPGLKITYRSEQNYIVLEVRNTLGEIIATNYYILDSEYVIK